MHGLTAGDASSDALTGAASASVSVVVAVKNGANHIGEALESALAQGALVKQIVVIDDASTDATRAVVQAQRDRKIELHDHRGTGVASARNRGAELATGDWLLFLDADDRLRKGAVSALVTAARRARDGVVVVYGDFDRIDELGRPCGARRFFRRQKPTGRVLEQAVAGYFVGNGGTAIVRNSAFRESGGFDTTLRYCEDWHLSCRLAAIGEFLFVPDTCVLDYRFHSANTMNGFRSYTDYVPAIDRVFTDAVIVEKLAAPQQLRLAAETHMRTYSARLALRDGAYSKAAKDIVNAILLRPRDTHNILIRVLLARVWI